MDHRGKVNVITKLAVGGAQGTALSYCSQLDPDRWAMTLVTGPELSPQGDLFEEAAGARERNPVSYDISPRAINLPSALRIEEAEADLVAGAIRALLT